MQDPVTPAHLIEWLTPLASANNDEACVQYMEKVVSRFQDAMGDDGLAKDLTSAMSAVPAELSAHLKTVFDRATSTRLLPNGARLSLWSLPVMLSLEQPVQAPLRLASGLESVRAQAALREVFDLGSTGWSMALPLLLTAQQLGALSLPALMDIPLQARASVRGERPNTILPVTQAELSPGEHALHLLFVTYCPCGTLEAPLPAAKPAQGRVYRWLLQSFAKQGIDGSLDWLSLCKPPRLFANALDDVQRLHFSARMHHRIQAAIERTAAQGHGLSAHIYAHPSAHGMGQLRVSVSLSSCLTQKVVGNITLSAYSVDAIEELGNTSALLRSLGLSRVILKPPSPPAPIRRHGGESRPEPSSDFAPLH